MFYYVLFKRLKGGFCAMNHQNERNQTSDTLDGINRRQLILQKLEEQGEVSVNALAQEFSVSPMTIRRDLHLFARQGILETHYGGAHLCKDRNKIPDFPARIEKMLRYKQAIGRTAASFIKEGDTIFLDSGTTSVQITKYFPDVHATLITNSMTAILQLGTNRKLKLVVAPGTYREQIGGTLDISTVEFLRRYHVNKSFIGTMFCSTDFGMTTSEELDAELKRTLCAQSDQSFLLADHTKFTGNSLVKFTEFWDYDYIITNKELDPALQDQVRKLNPNLILC